MWLCYRECAVGECAAGECAAGECAAGECAAGECGLSLWYQKSGSNHFLVHIS